MRRISRIFAWVLCGLYLCAIFASCNSPVEDTSESSASSSTDLSKIYTVTYLNDDGTILKEEKVPHGANAEMLFVPVRRGYHFIGWDQLCDAVTEDMTVKAKYEIAENQLFFAYEENGNIVTATLSIEGDVCVCGFETYISYHASNMDITDVKIHDQDEIDMDFSEIDDTVYVYFNDENCENIRKTFDIITFKFEKKNENATVVFFLKDIDIFDEAYNDCTYEIVNTEYICK